MIFQNLIEKGATKRGRTTKAKRSIKVSMLIQNRGIIKLYLDTNAKVRVHVRFSNYIREVKQ